MGVATKVQRSKGGGVTDVCWSPDGGRVFAGCRTSLFRVWETLKWSCEKWTNSTGRCKVRGGVLFGLAKVSLRYNYITYIHYLSKLYCYFVAVLSMPV